MFVTVKFFGFSGHLKLNALCSSFCIFNYRSVYLISKLDDLKKFSMITLANNVDCTVANLQKSIEVFK